MTKKLFLLCFLSFALGGCVTQVGGNESGGIVTGNGLTMATQTKFQAAEADCKKYNKRAIVKNISAWNGTLSYECVEIQSNVK
jgi:hypothetical protein